MSNTYRARAAAKVVNPKTGRADWIRAGEIVDEKDWRYKKLPGNFDSTESLVEQATAAPAELRTLSGPRASG